MGSISDSLSRLTDVHAGMSLATALTAERISAIQDAIRALARGENIFSGANIRKQSGPAWVMLSGSAESAASSGATIEYAPYEVISCDSNKSGDPLIGINFYSYLFKELDTSKRQTITGLLTDTPSSSDPGAFVVPSIGDKIWLEITISEATLVTAATISHGAAWSGYPAPKAVSSSGSGSYFPYYKMLIAEVVAATDLRSGTTYTVGTEQRKIIQCARENQLLTAWAIDGVPCLVPEGWSVPGLDT